MFKVSSMTITLCVGYVYNTPCGQIKGKASMQLKCIPENRDTNSATLYIDTLYPLLIVGLNLLVMSLIHKVYFNSLLL